MSIPNDNLSKPAILCIEDNSEALNLLVSLLMNRFPDFTLYSAMDGESGLRICKEKLPEIVVTDLFMQGMDGYELAEHIRQLKYETVIISVSAFSRSGYDKQSQTNFDFCLHKPLNFMELSRIIETAVFKINAEK